MPRKRLPAFRDRFVCIARLRPREWLEEGEYRLGLRCTRCNRVFWTFQAGRHASCPGCRMRAPIDMIPVPEGDGYFRFNFLGYTPGGEPAKASQAEDPQA